jgi:hypothetical protein
MNAARIATFCVIAIVVTIGVSRAQDEGPLVGLVDYRWQLGWVSSDSYRSRTRFLRNDRRRLAG